MVPVLCFGVGTGCSSGYVTPKSLFLKLCVVHTPGLPWFFLVPKLKTPTLSFAASCLTQTPDPPWKGSGERRSGQKPKEQEGKFTYLIFLG